MQLPLLLLTAITATTTSAWSMHFMNNQFDMTKMGDQPCTDFESNGAKHELKAKEKFSWTNDDGKEPGLKKCCVFLYPDTGCRGGHEKMEHKGPLQGLGSVCKSSTEEAKGTLKSMKVECKSRP